MKNVDFLDFGVCLIQTSLFVHLFHDLFLSYILPSSLLRHNCPKSCPRQLSVTIKTCLESVYHTYVQAEHAVDHSHEISTFQNDLEFIMFR